MAKFKTYDYRQRVLLPVSLEDQLMSGTLEFAIHTLVDKRLDMSIFEGKYRNDETGRAAYDPKILLKVVLLAYSRGLISSRRIEQACRENVVFMALACGQQPDHSTIYAEWGVDVEAALRRLSTIAISLHCWQGDDVGGFEGTGQAIGGGLAVTGNYPGRARTPDELRSDLDRALSLLPGHHRLNLHASYAETGGQEGRARRAPARALPRLDRLGEVAADRHGLQPHVLRPPAGRRRLYPGASGSGHPAVLDRSRHRLPPDRRGHRHGARARRASPTSGSPTAPRSRPIDRKGPRVRLAESLDAVFAEPIDPKFNKDAVEGKLFGIGSESYVVGSHEFYFGYAVTRKKLLCLDAGHYHPTEVVSDKISAVLQHLDEVLLHVSRGVRWDSDHVVILSDELEAIAQELVRGDYLGRVHIGLDFFDASINRVAAWVIGTRAMLKALLLALLEPTESLRRLEAEGDYTARLALLEELKAHALRRRLGPPLPHPRRPRRPRLAGGGQGLRARGALAR